MDMVAFGLSCGLTRLATIQMSAGQLDFSISGQPLSAHGGRIGEAAVTAIAIVWALPSAWSRSRVRQRSWVSQMVYLVRKLKGF